MVGRRNVETLLRRVREEIRAEGPDEAGYSDFIVLDAINSAIQDLAEVFPVRDVIKITAEAGVNDYDLSDTTVYKIEKLQYDGRLIDYMPTNAYADYKSDEDLGPVNRWTLFGKKLILVGKVEADKEISLWVSRSPNILKEKNDVPEVPDYADEAIVAYALSVCCREGRSFDRADYYYRIFLNQKNEILRRAVPQGQRYSQPKMKDDYWPAFRPGKMVRSRFQREPLTLPEEE